MIFFLLIILIKDIYKIKIPFKNIFLKGISVQFRYFFLKNYFKTTAFSIRTSKT